MERRSFLSRTATVGGLGLLAVTGPSLTQAQSAGTGLALPVTGYNSLTGAQLLGTFRPQTALVNNIGLPVIQGVLSLVGIGTGTVQLPITSSNASCPILDLTLGPLDLTLLGLEVHLNQVHLVIQANPAGGLLGQLLCAIANLLSGGGPNAQLATQLVRLLNQLLALFG